MPADDEILERLRQALRPPEAEPGASEVAELRRAVADQGPSAISRRVWPRRVAAGLAAAAVLVVLVLSPPLPRPVRSLARAVGLPVDSAKVADAKAAVAQLQAALDEGDSVKVARASARLEQRLQKLREEDRRRLSARSDPLLERARRAGAAPRPGSPVPAPGTSTTRPTTSSPSSTSSSTTSTTTRSTSSTTGRTSTTARR